MTIVSALVKDRAGVAEDSNDTSDSVRSRSERSVNHSGSDSETEVSAGPSRVHGRCLGDRGRGRGRVRGRGRSIGRGGVSLGVRGRGRGRTSRGRGTGSVARSSRSDDGLTGI